MVYAMAIMSVSDCRRYLGNLNSELTDKQVEQIRNALIPIINFSLQQAEEQWKEQNNLKR